MYIWSLEEIPRLELQKKKSSEYRHSFEATKSPRVNGDKSAWR
jgi:hypothetical protein